LHDDAGALIASNDDWQHPVIGGIITQDQVQDIQNSGDAPGDRTESAIDEKSALTCHQLKSRCDSFLKP